jgi:large subunit ribosomal protein L7/L12
MLAVSREPRVGAVLTSLLTESCAGKMATTIRPLSTTMRKVSRAGYSRIAASAARGAAFVRPASCRVLHHPSSPSTCCTLRRAPFSTDPAPSSSAASEHASSDPDSPIPPPPPIVWTTHRLTKDQILKVDQLFHKVLWLDMIETAILVDVMNTKLGRVTMTDKQKVALERYMDKFGTGGGDSSDAAASSKADAPQEDAPKLVDLKLAGYDAKQKIKVIKEVRSILGLGLKEAKELVEGAPKVLSKQIKPEQADELRERLVAAGAQVEVS